MNNRFLLFFIISLITLLKNVDAQTYFQQEVNYTINVKLNDVKHDLIADEKIEYINNSPTTLHYIYMHLWPNAYKNNQTALAKQLIENGNKVLYYATDAEMGYIDQLNFKVNGDSVKWEYLKDTIDICKIFLNQPLKSGEKIIITTPFHVKIPSAAISRLGHIDQSYQITQWYPKPAVFDKNGWNQMPYLNQGEFYSEFGSFDVSITLPKNYVLGATGDMTDGEKEMEWLEKNVAATEAMTSFDRNDMDFPPSDPETKTLHFKQNNVHDFAWFCDKRYHVLKGEVTTPYSQRKVTTWVMFTNAEGNLWKKSIPYVNDAIYYYSLWNGDYPYNNCTAVDGTISAGGGMEYPNITVIGSAGSDSELEIVIAHEVGHNWFYGILGSNEREHAWMDEGLNSFFENRYIETKYPDNKMIGDVAGKPIGKLFDLRRYNHKSMSELLYLLSATKNEDQAIENPSYNFTDFNYGAIVYSKTALVMGYLMAYIGEFEMDKAMQAYYEKWKFKHPMPDDFRKSLEESTGKNLSWLFDDLINSTKKLDYKIAFALKNSNNSWDIGIKNKGEVKGPVFIQGIKNNKLIGELIYDGFEGKYVLTFPPANVDYFKIDLREDMPEINRTNNRIKTKGLFKKVEPFKLQFLGSIDNPNKTQLFWAPVAGWNDYNKLMLGLAVYNHLLFQKKFEFEIMPMYATNTNSVTGYGHITYNILPKKTFQRITIGITATRYTYSNLQNDAEGNPLNLNFNKIAPELFLRLKKSEPRSPFTFDIRYRNITVIQDIPEYSSALMAYVSKTTTTNFNDFTFLFSKKDAIAPYDINVNIHGGEKIMKAALTAHYAYNFKRKNKGIEFRLFAGTFIVNQLEVNPYEFRLSGQIGPNPTAQIGSEDYFYDHIFLGRSENPGTLLGNQLTNTDGGFKFYSYIGDSEKWVAALNIKSSLGNIPLPIGVFADIGSAAPSSLQNQKVLYDFGFYIPVIKNIFEIYFPVALSQDFKDYKDTNVKNYAETIRFSLNLNLINPFNLISNFTL